MNSILKEEGYLEGEPGNYTITEKGKKYAYEQNHHCDTGGYLSYNRYWTTRTWDDEITAGLDITDDRKTELRQAISFAKQKPNGLDKIDFLADYNSSDEYIYEMEVNNDDEILIAGVNLLLLAASIYGVCKVDPYISCWWNDKAMPSLKRMTRNVSFKEEKVDIKSETNKGGE